jgi:hypothetical protein
MTIALSAHEIRLYISDPIQSGSIKRKKRKNIDRL